MRQLIMFSGAFAYEFRMQIRRLALWLTFLGLAIPLGLIFNDALKGWRTTSSVPGVVTDLTFFVVSAFLPIGVGALLSDRLPRDRKTHVDELLNTTMSGLGTRLFGKFLGSTCATLMPVVLLYLLALGWLFAMRPHHEILQALPQALAVFVVAALPGLLFVGAFSIVCPSFIWPPLYQFLFIGYWFWGNLLSPSYHIPSLSYTLLTPIGSYIYAGIFRYDTPIVSAKAATPLQGVESLLLLLGLGLLAIVTVRGYLSWQQGRQ